MVKGIKYLPVIVLEEYRWLGLLPESAANVICMSQNSHESSCHR